MLNVCFADATTRDARRRQLVVLYLAKFVQFSRFAGFVVVVAVAVAKLLIFSMGELWQLDRFIKRPPNCHLTNKIRLYTKEAELL